MRHNSKDKNGASVRDASRTSPAWEVIRTLVNAGTDPSRLLELYYWTREPGIIEMVRAYLEMPEAAQHMLGEYLHNSRPQSVSAAFDGQGRLVLSREIAPTRVRVEKLQQSARR